MRDVERIRSYLDEPELLCQLAEECAELAKAAMKVRRVQTKKNPTVCSAEEAWDNLIEEVADVMLVLETLAVNPNCARVQEIKDYKTRRWCGRLEAR